MQEEKQQFSRRIDRVASKLDVSLAELARRMKISRAALFAYRSGANRITPRVWAKLERLEESAAQGGVLYTPSPDTSALVRVQETESDRIGRLELRIERIETILDRLVAALNVDAGENDHDHDDT